MTDKHTHAFVTIKLIKIMGPLQRSYSGSPGDKAFLARVCECGAKNTFDYGPTEKMEALFEKLTAAVQKN